MKINEFVLKTEGRIIFLIKLTGVLILTAWLLSGAAQNSPPSGSFELESGRSAAVNAGLSGSNGAGFDGDVTAAMVNPAGLSHQSSTDVALHSILFPAGIYSFSIDGLIRRDSLWPVAAGLAYMNFGENRRYDPEGKELGSFPASTSRLTLGSSRMLSENLKIGVGMHYDLRRIGVYRSHLLLFDLGVVYRHQERTHYGLTVYNLGYELVPFEVERSKPPLDVSLYWQQKLVHLPFTFFLEMQKINLWNRMEYDHPLQEEGDILTGSEELPSRVKSLTGELLRHLVLGGQFGFGEPEKFWLRFSYDHWKNQQMHIPAIRSLDGVALGFGVQLAAFRLDYAWEKMYYNAGGHRLSLAFRFSEGNRRERGF